MKTNVLYGALFILAVIMILVMAFGKSKAPEVSSLAVSSPSSVLKESQAEVRSPLIETAGTNPIFFSQQAITVIKPAQRIDSPIAEAEREEESLSRRISEYSYGQGSSGSAGETKLEDTEITVSGVTRVGKYPTKEEAKDMNSKGIVLY